MKLPSEVNRFLILVFFMSWVATIPLWKHPGHLEHPFSGIIILFFMYTPALCALYMSFIISDPDKQNLFAFSLGNKWHWHWIFQWLFWPIATLCSLGIADLLGFYQVDLNCSGFAAWVSNSLNQVSDSSGQPLVRLPFTYLQMVWTYLILGSLAPFVLGLVTIGQELAWRGWLLSKLLFLGTHKAVLVSSLAWGCWYTPLILLGHRYPDHPILGVPLTVLFCLITGIILSWSRLKTNSIWPSVIGHCLILYSFPISHLLYQEGTEVHNTLAGLSGISGMLIPLGFIALLFRNKQLSSYPIFIEQRR